ncbi:hypothetical protein CEY12_06230 [Chryseobacterium sp. T16E-39]|uniref:hypothetical protein n=1 Tax=Chryseobacterium sp. T16E-39 TaxID=2015076 RepID=UPI000B5B2B02|nr:hypothetical protein [Chryseobacterium sp. T16E-39]ASK29726.1 hypothetical protein CEY12_06230 [Chryseobacterium sp. T16E-39]
MAGQINIGVAEIAIGAIAVDGGMGTTLAPLGYTEDGSASLSWDDPTETEFKVEEIDTPIHIETTDGKRSVVFKIADPDLSTFVETFGGTKTGTGADEVFNFPSNTVSIERSLQFTPKQGIGLRIPRAKITAKLSSEIGRAALMGIEVTATVLQPKKAGTAPIIAFKA